MLKFKFKYLNSRYQTDRLETKKQTKENMEVICKQEDILAKRGNDL